MAKPISKKNYDVFFELYGKKMKATVMAESENEAKQIVISKLIFHKVEVKKNDAFNKAVNQMEDIFDMLNI